VFDSLLSSLPQSALAQYIASSTAWLGMLSAMHLVGFALVMGSTLMANLRLAGWLFAERPAVEVTAPAARAIAIGLVISLITGGLHFITRAEAAAHNWIFQIKMALLLSAVLVQFLLQPGVVRSGSSTPGARRLTGLLGLALWWGVALAGCAFILFE
jgi:hypothetical protein